MTKEERKEYRNTIKSLNRETIRNKFDAKVMKMKTAKLLKKIELYKKSEELRNLSVDELNEAYAQFEELTA